MKKILQYILGTLAAISLVALSASAQTVFTPRQGGTGLGSGPTKGDLLVGSSTATYAKLGVGTNGKCLTASSTATFGVTCTSSSGITSLNGVTTSSQNFTSVNDTNVTLGITSSTSAHTFTLGWTGQLGITRGGTGTNNGSITGSGALTFAAGGSGNDVLITASDNALGNGGDINIQSGAAIGGNNDGGEMSIEAGTGNGVGQGGNFTFQAGQGGVTGDGGNMQIFGGLGGSGGGSGGTLSLNGGSAQGGTSNRYGVSSPQLAAKVYCVSESLHSQEL